jgi:putative tricarboxylic transport membrane protein
MGPGGRLVAPLGGALAAAGLLLDTRGLDQVARDGQLGPGFWPRLVLVCLGLTCVVKGLAEWRRVRAAEPSAPVLVDARALETGTLPEMSRRKLASAIGLIVLYVLAVPAVGFPLATGAFIAAFMSLCGARSGMALGANAALGTILLLYLFVKLVYLPLPKGEGPFEGVSLALYRALGIF